MATPELVGVAELAVILGVTTSYAHRIAGGKVRSLPGFPTPRRLKMGPVWLASDVYAWADQYWDRSGTALGLPPGKPEDTP